MARIISSRKKYVPVKDCFIPTTTHEEGPLQFEIDEQLNTTWYKK